MPGRNQWLTSLPKEARPTWAEVSLPRILDNYQAIQRRVGKTLDLMAIVKADAYGHGAVAVSKYLASHGVQWFGVATLEEALELRQAGIRRNLLVLGTFFPFQSAAAIESRIQITASSLEHLDALNCAATKKSKALVHLKFDTGMGRMGFSCADAKLLARGFARGRWQHVRLQGVCSHAASAEDIVSSQNAQQVRNFERVLEIFSSAGVEAPLRHFANSAGAIFHPQMRLDLVRVGIALYGYEPRDKKFRPMGTAPALSLKTRVLHLKNVARGTALGYGGTFVTRRPSVIATLPIGYADGVNRRLSFANRVPFRAKNPRPHPMRVIVRDQLAPIVGRVSMDLTLADVTDIKGVRISDEVILLGRSGKLAVTATDWADYLGTISYEVLCGISSRVYRVYR
jgi:alanine racemase